MELVRKAADILKKGGVVLYPTDTLYGLGVDALNKDALERLYILKGREGGKPMYSIFANLEAAQEYVEITPLARALAEKFLPGPLTLLLKKKNTVPSWATAGQETFGVRVPNNEFCLELAKEFGRPYTATSANKAGEPTPPTVIEILEQLDKEKIDFIVDVGELPKRLPSTIVDARGKVPIVMRQGALII